MTPAVRKAKQSGIEYHIHQYEHDANNGAYGAEAAEELGLSGATKARITQAPRRPVHRLKYIFC